MEVMLCISFLFTSLALLECFAKSNIRGVGTSFPSEVYKLWQPSYVVNRLPHADLELVYDAVGSVEAKEILYKNVDVEYASVESVISKNELSEHGDLIEFPVIAG